MESPKDRGTSRLILARRGLAVVPRGTRIVKAPLGTESSQQRFTRDAGRGGPAALLRALASTSRDRRRAPRILPPLRRLTDAFSNSR